MPSEIDKLKTLHGKKVVDIKLVWDDVLDDAFIEYIKFEDGTILELWGMSEPFFVSFAVEN